MARVQLVEIGTIGHAHPYVAELALPTDASAVVVGIRGEWFARAGLDWAEPYRFEGVGVTFDSLPPPPSLAYGREGADTIFVKFWRMRARRKGSPLYLESLWQPEWDLPRVALHGLETSPGEKGITAALRGRGLFDVMARRGPKPGKGFHQTRPWAAIESAWRALVDDALANDDKPTHLELAHRLGCDPATLYRNVTDAQFAELAAIESAMRLEYSRPK